MKGEFYVFEGIDGSGKSTQLGLLSAHLLRTRGEEPLVVYEPGGTSLGEAVRSILLDPSTGDMHAASEVFLFMAARSELVRERIRPALDRGRVVICDRFLWSSVVYQGIVGGLGVDAVLRIGRIAVDGVMPTRTFVLDLPVATALRRRSVTSADRIERRGRRFQEGVRRGFLELARRRGSRMVVVDARGRPEVVHGRVVENLPRATSRRGNTRVERRR